MNWKARVAIFALNLLAGYFLLKMFHSQDLHNPRDIYFMTFLFFIGISLSIFLGFKFIRPQWQGHQKWIATLIMVLFGVVIFTISFLILTDPQMIWHKIGDGIQSSGFLPTIFGFLFFLPAAALLGIAVGIPVWLPLWILNGVLFSVLKY